MKVAMMLISTGLLHDVLNLPRDIKIIGVDPWPIHDEGCYLRLESDRFPEKVEGAAVIKVEPIYIEGHWEFNNETNK